MKNTLDVHLEACRLAIKRRTKQTVQSRPRHSDLQLFSTEASPPHSSREPVESHSRSMARSRIPRAKSSNAVEINRLRQYSPRPDLISNLGLRNEIAEVTNFALGIVKRIADKRNVSDSVRATSLEPPLNRASFTSRTRSSFKVEANLTFLPQPSAPDDLPESPRAYAKPQKRDVQLFISKSKKYGIKFASPLDEADTPTRRGYQNEVDLKATLRGGFSAHVGLLDSQELSPFSQTEPSLRYSPDTPKESRKDKEPIMSIRSLISRRSVVADVKRSLHSTTGTKVKPSRLAL